MNSKIIIIIYVFLQFNASAQEMRIRILDSENLIPITYAHVLFDGKGGTITNSDGEFVIDTRKTKKIRISHLGYEEIEITSNDIKNNQRIHLNPKVTYLDEVKIYSIHGLMEKVSKSLKTNYINNTLNELMFFRLSLMKNENEGQMSEGYIQVQRDKYFDRSKDKKLEINILSNEKQNNLKNIDFQYYSFQKLLQLSESFIRLDNEYYDFDYIEIGDFFLKLKFTPKEKIVPNKTIYNGYIIIDLRNYALVEFQYSVAETYKKYLSKKEITQNLIKRDVNATKLVKWTKDDYTDKYQFSFLRIVDELIIEDKKSKTEDKYVATYEMHNLGSIEYLNLTDVKKRKTNSKKNVFEYSNFNSPNEIIRNLNPILRNIEQDSILTIIKRHDR
jgi:hypothetical protein